jgi:mannose-6-phosphate isomerase-like protein (cupin superfamily)
MITQTDDFLCIAAPLSTASRRRRGESTNPRWAALRNIGYTPRQGMGHGVEPHYHDFDEFWFFTSGHGEAWLDGVKHEVTPNTMVYTPKGVVHRFQMFVEFSTVGIQCRREGLRRAGHLHVARHGPPTPSANALVVPGDRNDGPIATSHPKLPVREMRLVRLPAGHETRRTTAGTEYWIPVDGVLGATIGATCLEVAGSDLGESRSTADVLMVRGGVDVALRGLTATTYVSIRE